MSDARSQAPPAEPAEATLDFLRLASCGRCGGRRRALVETATAMRGRCLDCGAELDAPLGIEVHEPLTVVGRAGQVIDRN